MGAACRARPAICLKGFDLRLLTVVSISPVQHGLRTGTSIQQHEQSVVPTVCSTLT